MKIFQKKVKNVLTFCVLQRNILFMAIVSIVGKSELPADFNEKEMRAFFSSVGMPEAAFHKKFPDLMSLDDVAVRFHSDDGRIGKALKKAMLASGEAQRRSILKRK